MGVVEGEVEVEVDREIRWEWTSYGRRWIAGLAGWLTGLGFL